MLGIYQSRKFRGACVVLIMPWWFVIIRFLEGRFSEVVILESIRTEWYKVIEYCRGWIFEMGGFELGGGIGKSGFFKYRLYVYCMLVCLRMCCLAVANYLQYLNTKVSRASSSTEMVHKRYKYTSRLVRNAPCLNLLS